MRYVPSRLAIACEIIDSVDANAAVETRRWQTVVDVFGAPGPGETRSAGAHHLTIGLMTDAIVKAGIRFTSWQLNEILAQ